MKKYLAGLVVVGVVVGFAAPAEAVWKMQTDKDEVTKVATSSETTAEEARQDIVEVIRAHRAFVKEVRAKRREARREAAQAAREAAASAVPAAPQPTVSVSYSSDGWGDELLAAGFPSSSISQMLYYIDRESGGDPTAINSSSGACGLLQLYPCYGGSAWLDPATNLHFAYEKYSADVDPGPGYTPAGYAPWGG